MSSHILSWPKPLGHQTTKRWHHCAMSCSDNSWPCGGEAQRAERAVQPAADFLRSHPGPGHIHTAGPHCSPQPLDCTPSTPSSAAKNSFHCSQEWDIPMHKWPDQAMSQMCVWYVYVCATAPGKALFWECAWTRRFCEQQGVLMKRNYWKRLQHIVLNLSHSSLKRDLNELFFLSYYAWDAVLVLLLFLITGDNSSLHIPEVTS